MILIETETKSIFVNEMATLAVEFDQEAGQVRVLTTETAATYNDVF